MKVLLFGSSGFFGGHIKDVLLEQGHSVYETFGRKRYNLICPEQTRSAFIGSRPDLVIHAAGLNGGLEFNRQFPADILTTNVQMATNIVENARIFDCKKVIFLNAVCAYPDKYRNGMSEKDFLDGYPDPSVEFHAYSKRYLVHLADSYNKQYNMQINNLCFTNLFGPRCSFDPVKSKVVEAVIKKIVDAKINKQNEITFWGSGNPKREFMYAPDAARLVVQLIDEKEFINIGTGKNISVKQLVNKIASIVQYNGKINWDISIPDGQSERVLKIDKLLSKYELNLTPFENALENTINYYIDHYCKDKIILPKKEEVKIYDGNNIK